MNLQTERLTDQICLARTRLETIKTNLKSHFVGLDGIIDRVISSIEAWYCLPEIQTRPTIVCLWGLTGNGKTDLVRRLVAELEMQDRFVELQLTNQGSSQHWHRNIQSLLTSSNISAEDPGILLLDEIQRFRSVDGDGKEIHDYAFQDLWMLLSDGNFAGAYDRKDRIMELLFDDLITIEKKEANAKPDAEPPKQLKFQQTYWQAKLLKRTLKLQESLETIIQWGPEKKIQVLNEKLNEKSTYESETYSKLLIFISGNIDEAYAMADATDETDIDADVFHQHSLRINMLTIKDALKKRFKPEQIARLGNTHIIYPALSKDSYQKIIRKRVTTILKSVSEQSGVTFTPDESVYQAIYQNGVFPTQGTRPVFSTISGFFESLLPKFTLIALQKQISQVNLSYVDRHLRAKIGDEVVSILNEGEIDKIKVSRGNPDSLCRVAVHEAGHAVMYAVLMKHAPTQIVALASSEDKKGFVGFHTFDHSYQASLNKIAIGLGGKVAEEIVFGGKASAGVYKDLENATHMAGSMIRAYGMGNTLSRMAQPSVDQNNWYNTTETNEAIEQMLQEQHAVTLQTLRQRLPLLHEVSDRLIADGKISSEDFQTLCREHGLEIRIADAKEVLYPPLREAYNAFWRENR